MRSKSQIYADIVFQQVRDLVAESPSEEHQKLAGKYRSLCKRSGGVMRTVGLIQFLTFLAAKAQKDREKHHEYLLHHLQASLNETGVVLSADPKALLRIVREQALPEYLRTTTEVLKLLQWHRRMAEVLIAKEEPDESH